jgi:predicted house-cleaning noncanonical NTP pyrophosphatase (MazG superfamily)
MGRVYYNKLIRDRIPEKIAAAGSACAIRTIADMAEFEQELLKKVVEEAHALSMVRDRAAFLDEYADLMVVLKELSLRMGCTEVEIQTALQENVAKKGGFTQRLFLSWSSDDTYRSNETPQGISTTK